MIGAESPKRAGNRCGGRTWSKSTAPELAEAGAQKIKNMVQKKIFAELITIGDELLIGQVVDTNSAWMASQLSMAGFVVRRISSVNDERESIREALDAARKKATVVIITGGLGPTRDDKTKRTLCEYFNSVPVFNLDQFEQIRRIFSELGREVSELNRKQAEVPENCICLVNKYGTAPGMWFDVDDQVIVSLPGVPFEMKQLMSEQVLPMLAQRYKTLDTEYRTFLTQGLGESTLAEMISAWEDSLPSNMQLAYLPKAGQVRLRLSAGGADRDKLRAQLDEQSRELYRLVGKYIYGEGDVSLQQVVFDLLMQQKRTLSLAESCTGGFLSHLITSIPGSSEVYNGGAVTYSNDLKIKILGVKGSTLTGHGAVSRETVEEMALGAIRAFDSDYSIAISGIAGPGGGTPEKPVGTVWIAIAQKEGLMLSKKFLFGSSRLRNIEVAALSALNLFRRLLQGWKPS